MKLSDSPSRSRLDLGVEGGDRERLPQAAEQHALDVEARRYRVVLAGPGEGDGAQIVERAGAGNPAASIEDPPRQSAGAGRDRPALAAGEVAEVEMRRRRPVQRGDGADAREIIERGTVAAEQ